MDVREKLVELIASKECDYYSGVYETWVEHDCEKCGADNCSVAQLADYLIAHGVTVQEEAKLYWKPVKPDEWNLTCAACDSHLGCKENASFCPECGAKFVYPKAVMPQPPKGE